MSEGLFYIRNEERDPRCLKVRNTYKCEPVQGEDGVWTYSYTSWGTIYPSLDTWDAGAVVVMEVEPVSDVLPRFVSYETGEILESDSTHAVLRYTERRFCRDRGGERRSGGELPAAQGRRVRRTLVVAGQISQGERWPAIARDRLEHDALPERLTLGVVL